MDFILNIGRRTSLDVGGDGNDLPTASMVRTIARVSSRNGAHATVKAVVMGIVDGAEDTVVVSLQAGTFPQVRDICKELCKELYQEAIAFGYVTATSGVASLRGELVGPLAANWGTFNPALFHTLEDEE